MALIIGIDIGGTFTDIAALETDSGRHTATKVSSTPKDFSQGFFAGIDKMLRITGAPPGDVSRLVHGTTVATNAILESKGSKIGILTTKGFRDTLIIGREFRTEMYSVLFDPETPTFLCDRERILEIEERIDSHGNVLTPLNEADVIRAVDNLAKKHGVEAISVCYLFSFLNSAHEDRTEQIIRERYPDIRISLSHVLNPRFREYERMVITAFDAYIGPVMERYIKKLEEGVSRRRINIVLQVMQSRGGITSATMCTEKPVVTLLSGPAGGVIGGKFICSLCGRENIITLDMGGTSNDVALIYRGRVRLSLEGKIGKYPCRQSMMDINTIGAGGGSVAWVDPAGGLKVGPQSAGADPGPACYGLGGEEPTVTDASVVMGYLNPNYFAAGEVKLNPDLARKAIQGRVATRLGMDVEKAAAGIHRIVNNNMADQVRRISVYKGYDPRHFSLIAFGGAGPVAAGRLVQILGLKEAIIPPTPGVLSAFGLLAANIEHEEVITYPAEASEVNPQEIEKVLRRLEALCEQKREGVGISQTSLEIRHSTEMRYMGQSYELEVPFPEGTGRITKETIKELVTRFHGVHQSLYQHSKPDNPVQFIAFRTVFSQKPVPMPTLQKGTTAGEVAPKGKRMAYFDENQRFVDTPLYERAKLVPKQGIKGPAIVEQGDTTTVIYPNEKATVDDWGNLIIAIAS
jgi:N-methylhydantoinase A